MEIGINTNKRWFRSGLIFMFWFFADSSFAIYHWDTQKELINSKIAKKHWLLVDPHCKPCDEILLKLETFCKGKRPSAQKIGFFGVGFHKPSILKKLRSFNKGYDVYVGSQGEFYNMYKIQGSPAWLTKDRQKVIQGTSPILKIMKKFAHFCKV